MIKIRKSEERGHANHGWLDTNYAFSFSDYYDPNYMGFRHLRVINEDYISGGNGFGTHPHNNMEIITYIIDGALEHKDSMGTGSVIHSGDVQRMSAGSGVTHSEFNHLKDKKTHLLQIWILPEKRNIEPSYEEKTFDQKAKLNNLLLIASKNGENNSLHINQDVNLYASILEKNQNLRYETSKNRNTWIQIVKGELKLNGEFFLSQGDGVAISNQEELILVAQSDCEFLLFDLL